jgi:signal transduction histidine kinase
MQLAETEWEGEPVYLAALRDITARREWEARLRYAQKMEAIGNLTRGIAHDFNNTLAAIVGYASVLEMRVGQQETLRAPIQQILAAADRATGLTRALVAFSRDQPGQIRAFDLTEMVARTGKLLPPLLGNAIVFSTDLPGQPLPVLADSTQIEQVLINLAVNARQAMPKGGSLHLQLQEESLGPEFRKGHGFGRMGRFARISMNDNGPGMEETICEKIFDPFFTTKEPGEGCGLGLSMVYGIVKQHRGYILCHSRPGEGTTFEIYLPLTEPAATQEAPG